jgi:autotransporter-associated beta strand protein
MAATREFNTASGGLTVSGEISDSGAALGLTKTGTGTLTFTGANTYSGDTTVNAGTLQLGDGTVNGSIAGASIVNNASLVYKLNGSDVTVANVISGGGNFTKSGTGKLTLSVAQTYTGVTTVNSGTLAFSSTIAGVQVNINGASRVELNADNTGYAKTFTFDSAGGGTLYGSTGVNGPRVGGGTITTSGGARDTLSGTNWKVEGGGFTFNVADGDDATSDLQVSARITNVGAVTKTGNGILAFSAANVYTGGTTVSNGTLRVNNASGSGTGSGAVEVKAGATLGGSGAIGGGVAVAATGTLDAGSASNVVGQIAITNGVTFAANAILHVDITDDSNADRVEAGGLVSGGMVNVDVNAPPSLTIGSVWTIVHSSQPITATFAAPARYQIVLPDAYTVQLHFPPLSGTVFRFH